MLNKKRCGPCKLIAPRVKEWAAENHNALFYKFDVDEVPDVGSELGITAMPTFTFFNDEQLASGETEKVKVKDVVGVNFPQLISTLEELTGFKHSAQPKSKA
jgi:thiol-disulfide isomerase/thioredoxin